MLRQAKDFKDFKLRARDGDIGKVKEFYFSDENWTVRYLIAETGGWLSGSRVLISPYALEPANDVDEIIPVRLTKEQIEDGPSPSEHEPVSRHFEVQYAAYYGQPMYWSGPYAWGSVPYPGPYSTPYPGEMADRSLEYIHREKDLDPHLRSTQAVTGYHIQAPDGEIGHVEDFIIDDETWTIRYMVVDTKNWWPGKHVLVSPEWIRDVSWEDSKVFVTVPRSVIESSPEYAGQPFDREYERALFGHYN